MKETGKNLVMVIRDHSLVAGIIAATTVAITAITAIVIANNKKKSVEMLPTIETE